MSGHIFWIPLEKETNHRLDTLIVVINNGFNSFIFTNNRRGNFLPRRLFVNKAGYTGQILVFSYANNIENYLLIIGIER